MPETYTTKVEIGENQVLDCNTEELQKLLEEDRKRVLGTDWFHNGTTRRIDRVDEFNVSDIDAGSYVCMATLLGMKNRKHRVVMTSHYLYFGYKVVEANLLELKMDISIHSILVKGIYRFKFHWYKDSRAVDSPSNKTFQLSMLPSENIGTYVGCFEKKAVPEGALLT